MEQEWAQCCPNGTTVKGQELVRWVALGRTDTKQVSHGEISFHDATELHVRRDCVTL